MTIYSTQLDKVPRCANPECARILDMITGESEKPTPGDFTICIYCDRVQVFTPELLLRPATPSEIFTAAMEFDLGRYLRAVKAARAKHKWNDK